MGEWRPEPGSISPDPLLPGATRCHQLPETPSKPFTFSFFNLFIFGCVGSSLLCVGFL